MKAGDKVIIYSKDSVWNTAKSKMLISKGIYVKDYGRYISILTKYGYRVSILKCDIKKAVVLEDK